jgi:hypothetical protein
LRLDADGGTRWGRSLWVLVPSVVVIAGIGLMLRTGVLAASLTVQGGTTSLATSSLYGTNFGAALIDQADESSTGVVSTKHVLRMGFANGMINGLCLAERQSVAGVNFTLLVTAGDTNPGTWEINTVNTVLDVNNATGVLDMDGLVDLNINGPDVVTVTDSSGAYVPNPLNSPEDRFGIQAHYAKFDTVTANVQDMQMPGILTTPAIDISVKPGTVSCPTPPAPTGTPGTP